MASGNYGTIRCADFKPSEAEIYYTFSPSRSEKSSQLLKLDSNQILEKMDDPDNSGLIFSGLYQLNLPTSIFNRKGYYNILIRPKRLKTRIVDCGVLSGQSNVRGIIFNLADVPSEFVAKFENNALNGWRIEYLEPSPNVQEKKIQNLFRILTSNNKCEAVSENLTNTSQKSIKYRYNDNASLVFCTVTPSASNNSKANSSLFIGSPNQEVILTPTIFDPVAIEINLVEHDIETLSLGIFGNQTMSVSDGKRTYYNEDNEIYKQFNEYTVQDDVNDERLFEVKEQILDIDFSKDFNNIVKE